MENSLRFYVNIQNDTLKVKLYLIYKLITDSKIFGKKF